MKFSATKRLGALAVAGLALTALAACKPDAEGSPPVAVVSKTTEAPKTTPGTPKTPTEAPTTEAPTTTAPPPPPPTTAAPVTVPAAPEPFAGETVSQKNARQKAADYLDFSSFSHSGLIKQLAFEGFSETDATYGVDALNVDWNQQAAKKAADYLDFSSFSHSGLIDQLVFDGFTQAQAEFGVGTTGL